MNQVTTIAFAKTYKRLKLSTILSLTFLSINAPTLLRAQSLIVGIPSANVAHKGKLELTHESQFNWWEGNLKWNSFNFLCYGLNDRTELTVSFNNLSSPASGNLTLGAGFKHIVPLGVAARNELKLTVGSNALISVQNRGVGGWVYSHLSGRVPATRTRLTGGLSYGTEQAFGFRTTRSGLNGADIIKPLRPLSVIVGIEQPIVGHFSLIADWFSGTHDLAAVIAAAQYETPRITYIAGYKRTNDQTNGANAIIVELMFRF